MNQPDAAVEHIDENETGVAPENQLNPHLGHQDPDQRSDDSQDDRELKDSDDGQGDSPAPVEDSDDKSKPREDDSAMQRKLAELAFENRQLKRQVEAQQAQGAEDRGEPEPEPLKTLKDFGYDEQQFNRYLIGVAKEEAKRETLAETYRSNAQTDAQRAADEFASREEAFEAENPGFKERLHKDDLHITQEMAAFIMDPTSEVGLHVGDYLARNPVEAAKIAALPETAQVRKMVALEARIEKEVAKAKAEKSKASKAPEPPTTTVDGNDPGLSLNPANPKDADAMSDEEWAKARNRQLEKRRKR